MQRTVLTYGLIAGAILSAMLLLSIPLQDEIGFDRGVILGYATMVLAFLMVYFGIRSYRDGVAGGSLTFGRALKVGLLIMLVATVCYVATWEFIFFKLAPDFGDKYAAYALEEARQSGGTEASVYPAHCRMFMERRTLPGEDGARALHEVERAAIVRALEQTRYNKTAAAKQLGMTFRALRYRIKKLGIE